MLADASTCFHKRFNHVSNVCGVQHEQHVKFQLVPPHIHRRNAAERAIRTYKNHFIAGLASTDQNFPLHLWDKLVPQAEITLNLLRNSRLHPHLSICHLYNCHTPASTRSSPPHYDKDANIPVSWSTPLHRLAARKLNGTSS